MDRLRAVRSFRDGAMTRHIMKTLDNGLRVVCIPQPHLHLCEVSCYVGVGSRHDPEEFSGIAHFLEHMLFRGTADYPDSLSLEEAFEELGGGANAATDVETTCYFSRFHPDNLAPGLGLFASMLQRPLFNDIETERRIIVEEILEDLNEQGNEINPDTLMAQQLWPGTVLSRSTLGTVESLGRVDEAALRTHFRRYYRPRNVVIAVAGQVIPENVFAAVENHFSGWSDGTFPTVSPVQSAPAEQRLLWVDDSASQLAVQLAFLLPGRDDTHALLLRILRRILSGGVTSRLMLKLRETLGLVYGVEASLSLLAETGALAVDFSVAPENLVSAVEACLEVFAELRSQPVPKAEFDRVVKSYLYDLDFAKDNPEEMVTRYGWGELVGFVRGIESDRQGLLVATPDEILQTVRDCLDPGQMRLVVVGPESSSRKRQVEELLVNFAAPLS